jgi:hypothetical protein
MAFIDRGKWHDPICCSFGYVGVKRHVIQSYTALSYVWGSPKAVETIKIDGQDHNISINLACAIRHLRDEKNVVSIWIDAIVRMFNILAWLWAD